MQHILMDLPLITLTSLYKFALLNWNVQLLNPRSFFAELLKSSISLKWWKQIAMLLTSPNIYTYVDSDLIIIGHYKLSFVDLHRLNDNQILLHWNYIYLNNLMCCVVFANASVICVPVVLVIQIVNMCQLNISIFTCYWNGNTYRKTPNIRRNLLGNKVVDHLDVVGASSVDGAPATSSFPTSMD